MELTQREAENRNYLKEKKPRVYEKIQDFDSRIHRGESIAIIQMQYSYKCNLACQHCCIKRMQGIARRSMTVRDVRVLADQADAMGLARFVITGGEPLIFSELDQIVEAIGPERFYINMDTNGWFLDTEKARHLKSIGVDRVQLSIDGFDAETHDQFRGRKGSHERAMRAVDACLEAGLGIFIQTVVTSRRLHSDEFIEFVEHFNKRGIGVFVSFAKPVGAWEGNYSCCIDDKGPDVEGGDLAYFRTLEKKYRLFSHLTPAYGLNMGCIAVKGMFSITQFGDVLPCPYMQISMGNIFEEPLKDIVDRALGIRWFGEKIDTCVIAQDRSFFRQVLEKKIYGRELPVSHKDVFTLPGDKTRTPFQNRL